MYKWWTILLWWRIGGEPAPGVKLGPVSLLCYRWFKGEFCFEVHLCNKPLIGFGPGAPASAYL